MGQGINTGFIRTIETPLASDTVANGNYEFDAGAHGPPNNVLEYFHFVDGAGVQADATAGTIVVTLSSGADIFQTVPNGSFDADQARIGTRAKPNGFGKAEKIRITLTGVTGVVGFRGLLTQNA